MVFVLPLVLALAFMLAALAVGWTCSSMLQANAQREALQEAGLMMDSALSMRAYTAEEIVPLLNAQMGKAFVDYLCHIKEAEIARFNLEVSEWEHREYFDMF